VVVRPFTDELPKVFIGALHAGVVLGDVAAGEHKEIVVARTDELVPARAVDDATHEDLLRRG
jgi:hypothetical protein